MTEPSARLSTRRLLDLTQRLALGSRRQAQDFTLKPWSPNRRSAFHPPALPASGAGDQLQLSGTLSPKFPETGPINIKLEGRSRDRTLHADDLQVLSQSSRTALSASGDIGFLGGWPQLHLTGNWTALRYPFLGKTLIQSKRGEFTLDGKVPYRYTVSADATGWSRTTMLSSRGLFDRDAITWEDLRAQHARRADPVERFAWISAATRRGR